MPPTLTLSRWFKDHSKAAAKARTFLYQGGSTRDCVEMLRAKHAYPFADHTALRAWALRNYPDDYVSRERKAAERFFVSDQQVKALDKTADFFVTCAVNNSPACRPALRALEHAAAECKGTIAVLPIRYKNPTRRGEIPEDEWWADELRPYLIENEIRPHPLLSIMVTKTAATAADPLPARLNGRTKARSAVFGHPQLAMRCVPTPQEKLPKILFASGAITEKAYSDTFAGGMADFHHSVAAIKVEVRGNRFHLRDLTWDGKRFVDCDRAYTARGIRAADSAAALVMGDIHVGLVDPLVEAATFGPSGIVEALSPEMLVLHDLFDGRTVNPHERGRALIEAARAKFRVAEEVAAVRAWLDRIPASIPRIEVVDSNHDDFLRRWLELGRSHSPADAELFHHLSWQMLKTQRETGEFPNALELALGELPDRTHFLASGESLLVKDVELGMHGHRGPNGARGSMRNLSQIGVRSIIGHVHSPGIYQGVYAAGLSAIYDHGYNRGGPSSWLQAHVALHANGLRQMLAIINGKWRG